MGVAALIAMVVFVIIMLVGIRRGDALSDDLDGPLFWLFTIPLMGSFLVMVVWFVKTCVMK